MRAVVRSVITPRPVCTGRGKDGNGHFRRYLGLARLYLHPESPFQGFLLRVVLIHFFFGVYWVGTRIFTWLCMQENRGASDVENVDGPHNFMPFTVVPGAPRDQGFGLVGT